MSPVGVNGAFPFHGSNTSKRRSKGIRWRRHRHFPHQCPPIYGRYRWKKGRGLRVWGCKDLFEDESGTECLLV